MKRNAYTCKAHATQGSCITMVLIMVSIVTTIILCAWRTTAYSYEFALQRSYYQKHMAMAEGLLNYGISLVKVNVEQLFAQKHELIINVDSWPGQSLRKNQGQITITPTKAQISVRAQITEENRLVCGLSCLLTQEKSFEKNIKPLVVSEWSIDDSR